MRIKPLIYVVVVAASAVPVLVASAGRKPGAGDPDIPSAALDALGEGRHWRASRILQDYLAAQKDTSPATVLLAAEAAAGWGDWSTVASLLEGRPWLDGVGGGRGWWLLGRSHDAHEAWDHAQRDYTRYLDVASRATSRDRGLTRLRRARSLARAGATAEALEAYDAAAGDLPQLQDWIRLFAAEAAAAVGDTAAVAARLADAGELAGDRGWSLVVRARLEALDSAGAVDALRDAATSRPSAADRAEAWQWLGRLALAAADTAEAKDAFGRAIRTASRSVAAIDAARAMTELPLDADESLAVGRLYLRHGNLDRAMAGLGAYLDAGIGTATQRLDVRMDYADALFRAGRFPEAERLLLALWQEAAASRPATAAEALFLAGRAQYRSGRTTTGLATFQRVVDSFPGQDAAARAAFMIADLNHDGGHLDTARRAYARVVELAPDLNEAGLARMRLGGMALTGGDPDSAARIFDRYRQRYPDGRRVGQATYWAGRSYEAAGDTATARQRYAEVAGRDPTSYYGVAGARRLGQTVPELELEPAPTVAPEVEARAAAALERIDLLDAIGRDDAVAWEIDRAQLELAREEGGLYPLAEGLNARGRSATGITLGWRIREAQGAWNERLLRIIYPFPYRSMVTAEAEARGLDPFFVAGLIRRESAFDRTARSGAGAMGLMQIMPATGRSLARRAGIRHFDTSMLNDAELNLHLGMAYMEQLMDRYNGRIADVLVAYNAGPTRMARWRDLPEHDGDPELFVERIPFSETRDYVRYVQEHASLYAALYGPAVDQAAE